MCSFEGVVIRGNLKNLAREAPVSILYSGCGLFAATPIFLQIGV